MKNKAIIIDGVDVSRCDELYNNCCCDNGSFYCKDQPNCKFKIEKRGYKLEEITEFTTQQDLIETITHLRVLNAELESYNEQLKESIDCEIKENKILRKQLERQQYYLDKIRDYELQFLDVDWDEYEQHACDTEYSPIIDYVELALGEKDE